MLAGHPPQPGPGYRHGPAGVFPVSVNSSPAGTRTTDARAVPVKPQVVSHGPACQWRRSPCPRVTGPVPTGLVMMVPVGLAVVVEVTGFPAYTRVPAVTVVPPV